MLVVAKINVTLNEGSFRRGNIYRCRKEPENNRFWVETDEGREQGFFLSDFYSFFELYKEEN